MAEEIKGNISLHYNKRVYLNLKNKPEKNENYRKANMALYEGLINKKLADLYPEQLSLKEYIDKEKYRSFVLTTAGQGLLIGIGNEHGTGAKVKMNGKDKESHEFKMGFYFDHTTGIPIITGHNLKGRIRSFFPIAYKEGKKKDAIAECLLSDIEDCFKNEENFNIDEWGIDKIKDLENAIFEGEMNNKKINPLIQDKFLGAYPSKSCSKAFTYLIPEKYKTRKGDEKYDGEKSIDVPAGTFLFDDTLAHHPHPLKNPTPLRFLKILPNVEITFQFKLNDEGGLNAGQKAKLFEYLLRKYGAGAKTSSGYGQFKKDESISKGKYEPPKFNNFTPIELTDVEDDQNNREYAPPQKTYPLPKSSPKTITQVDHWLGLSDAKQGSIIDATILAYENGNAKIQLHIKGTPIVLGLQGRYEKDETIKVRICETNGSLAKGNYKIVRVVVCKSK